MGWRHKLPKGKKTRILGELKTAEQTLAYSSAGLIFQKELVSFWQLDCNLQEFNTFRLAPTCREKYMHNKRLHEQLIKTNLAINDGIEWILAYLQDL